MVTGCKAAGLILAALRDVIILPYIFLYRAVTDLKGSGL